MTLPATSPLTRCDGRERALQSIEDCRSVREQHLTGGRENDVASLALEQLGPYFLFENRQLLGNGGWGVGEGVSGGGDRAALGDLAEKAKAFGI